MRCLYTRSVCYPHPLIPLCLGIAALLNGCVTDAMSCDGPCNIAQDTKSAARITTVYHPSATMTPLTAPGAAAEPMSHQGGADLANLMLAQLSVPKPNAQTTQVTDGADDPSRASLERAAAYSRRHDGLALIVMKADGRVLFEDYAQGAGPNKPHLLASGTKSFWGVLAVAAAQDGMLDLDEKVADTIPEWRSDPRKARITVRQLLNFTSGLDSPLSEMRGKGSAEDKFLQALQAQAASEPGSVFNYHPVHLYAFGGWLKRKLAASGERMDDPLDYLSSRILNPIGMKIGHWRRDKAGNPAMPNGASLAPREWIKFGQLLVNKGRWQNHQIIEEEYIQELFQGSQANPAYGLTFWLHKGVEDPEEVGLSSSRNERRLQRSEVGSIDRSAPIDVAMAAGKGKQRLYIIPSRALVVLRLGRPNPEWQDKAFMTRLLGVSADVPADQRSKTGASDVGSAAAKGTPSSGLGGTSDENWREACQADIRRLCPDRTNTMKALRQCFRTSRRDFSTKCRQALRAARRTLGSDPGDYQ